VELDSALSSFVTGSGGAFTITSGSIAAGNLVLTKADGSDVALTIDSNFSGTGGSFAGALTSTNGTPAIQTNTWDAYTFVDGTSVGGPDTLAFSTAGALTVPAGGVINIASFVPVGGGAAMTLAQDYSASTQFGSAFSVNGLAQNGFTTGRLSGLDIDGKGIIFARFTNGQSSVQGQIALADFRNVQGLQPVSDTSWGETFASGSVTIGSPGTASLGLIQSGALEQSNVDLSEELVNMIIAQRSFQANAEVIQTSDTITQSIINLR
jgi:flagellar hook protein FlgE